MKEYKTVAGPIGLRIGAKESYADAVKQYAAIIDRETVGGWELDCIEKIPVEKAPGCLESLMGKQATVVEFNMLVFVRNDSEYTSGSFANGTVEVDFDKIEESKEISEDIYDVPRENISENEKRNEDDISMNTKYEQSNIVIRILANIYDIIDRIVKHLPENNPIRKIVGKILDLFSRFIFK